MNRWMTRFAFGSKCGLRGASGERERSASSAAPASDASRPARPSEAMPMTVRTMSSRRVSESGRPATGSSSGSDVVVGIGVSGVGRSVDPALVARIDEGRAPLGGAGLVGDGLAPLVHLEAALRARPAAPHHLADVGRHPDDRHGGVTVAAIGGGGGEGPGAAVAGGGAGEPANGAGP